MQKRKGAKKRREAAPASAAQPSAAAVEAPAAVADMGHGAPPALEPAAAAEAPERESTEGRQCLIGSVLAAAAVVALLYCHHAAVRLLSPQTGEWLAASFCSLALFALALVAAVAGHGVADGLAAVRDGPSARSPAAAAAGWAAASATALPLALRRGAALRLAGSWLLAPRLADDPALRISDAAVTLRCMALAAAACGPLFSALGFAAGAAAADALRPLAPASRALRLLPTLLVLASAAGAAMAHGLPPGAVPARPAACLPPLITAATAAVAIILLPSLLPHLAARQQQQRQQQQTGRREGAVGGGSFASRLRAAALAVLAAAALAAWPSRTPCGSITTGSAPRHVEGGRYRILWECEAAAGGKLAVVEGLYKERYRYRLLRMDHSVLGGEYVAPADVAGQSVYTAFHLQQAAVLLRPGGSRSLHVGLGVGTAVKGMQRLGIAADCLELHPEVLLAARHHFGLRPEALGGRARVGDAAALVPGLRGAGRKPGEAAPQAQRYDYILHDVFSGGGTPPALMQPPFFRQLGRLLAPGGVLAVNYYGSKGPGLKAAWCRLRLVFDSVRAFSDVERGRVRNHVLFASSADLGAANLTAALQALQAGSGSGAAGGGGDATGLGAGQGGAVDPLQLRVWRALPGQEVQLVFDRQRCRQLLSWHDGLPAGRPGGGGGAPPRGRPPLLWRQLKEVRERHAAAVAHWVVARTQFADSLWLS